MGIYSMLAFFQKGGIFMYPILLVFLTGLTIALEPYPQYEPENMEPAISNAGQG
jgi:hypothetical protein